MRRGWGIESEMGEICTLGSSEFAAAFRKKRCVLPGRCGQGACVFGCTQNIFPLYSAAAFSQPFLTMQRAASAAWDMAS